MPGSKQYIGRRGRGEVKEERGKETRIIL